MVSVSFTIGDPSGSHSERWKMDVSGGPISLQPQSPDYGEVATITLNQFRKSKEYTVRVEHLGTHPEYDASTKDESRQTKYLGTSWYGSPSPDYDYEAGVSPSDVGYYIKDPNFLLGTNYASSTNGAAGKTATFGFPKPDMIFTKPNGAGSLSEAEEDEPGLVILLNNNDSNADGQIDMDHPYGAEDPEMIPVRLDVLLEATLDIGTVTLSQAGPGRLRLWDPSDWQNPLELPKSWDLSDPVQRNKVRGKTFYLEAVAPSTSARDTILSFSYTGNRPGTTSDTANLTLLPVEVVSISVVGETTPAEPFSIEGSEGVMLSAAAQLRGSFKVPAEFRSRFSGRLVQNIHATRVVTYTTPPPTAYATRSGGMVFDGATEEGDVDIAPDGVITVQFNDVPLQWVPTGPVNACEIDDKFSLYIQYRFDEGPWITLGKCNWTFRATSTFDSDEGWSGSATTTSATGSRSSDHPKMAPPKWPDDCPWTDE